MRDSAYLLLIVAIILSVASVQGEDFNPWELVNGCQTLATSSTVRYPKCAACFTGYNLSSTLQCDYDVSKCSNSQGGQCGISNCLQQSLNYNYYSSYGYLSYCSTCAAQYSTIQNICQYQCRYSGTFKSFAPDCKPGCDISYCSRCDSSDSRLCIACQTGYYLQEEICVSQCSDGYFLDSSSQTCTACPAQCQKCNSLTECTVCIASDITMPPTCVCPQGMKFSKGNCASECSYQYKANDSGTCEKYCKKKYEYPIFAYDGSLFNCTSVIKSSDAYCFNNLFALNSTENIQLSLSKLDSNSQYYSLSANFSQTPQVCYSIQLYGANSLQIPLYSEQIGIESYKTTFSFPVEYIDNSSVTCTQKKCSLELRLLWLNQLQYIYKILIDIQLEAVLSNTLGYSGSYSTVEVVCENCVIPATQLANSTLALNCGTSQSCNSTSINAPIGSDIVVTQTVETSLSQNKVLPHSLKIDYFDSNAGQQTVIYITGYTYDNSVLGKITYTFKASAVTNGQLTVTSAIKNVKVTRMLEASGSSSNSIRYPQLKIDLISGVSSPKKESEQSSGSINMILAVILGIVVVGGTVGFYYFLQRKKAMKASRVERQGENNVQDSPQQVKIIEQPALAVATSQRLEQIQLPISSLKIRQDDIQIQFPVEPPQQYNVVSLVHPNAEEDRVIDQKSLRQLSQIHIDFIIPNLEGVIQQQNVQSLQDSFLDKSQSKNLKDEEEDKYSIPCGIIKLTDESDDDEEEE